MAGLQALLLHADVCSTFAFPNFTFFYLGCGCGAWDRGLLGLGLIPVCLYRIVNICRVSNLEYVGVYVNG